MSKETEGYNNRDHYVKIRERCSSAAGGNEKGFNEKIFYVSTGAILLSITFLSDLFGPDEKISGTCWLVASWFGFGFAIVVHILSFLHCAESFINLRNKFDKFLVKDPVKTAPEEYKEEGGRLENRLKRVNNRSRCYNMTTAALFILGLVAFIIFAIINLKTLAQ
jgi:hypothetical protein